MLVKTRVFCCFLLLLAALMPLPCRAQPAPWPAGAVPRTLLDSLRYLRTRSTAEYGTNMAACYRTRQQTLRLAQRLSDKRVLSDCWRALGAACDDAHSYEAQHCFEQALALARQAHWPVGQGEAYTGMGVTAVANSNYHRALQFYRLAHEQFAAAPAAETTPTDRLDNYLMVLTNEINVYYQLNDGKRAARLCRQALARRKQALAAATTLAQRAEIIKKTNTIICTILSMQAALYQEVQQPDSARQATEQGLRLVTNVEDRAGLLLSLVEVELSQDQAPAAYRHVRESLRLARRGGYVNTTSDGLLMLAKTLRALHRPEAFDSLQAHMAFREARDQKARLADLTQAQARFNNREQQARIQALEQERRLTAQAKELTLLRTRQQLAGLGSGAVLLLLAAVTFFGRYRRRQAAARALAETTLRRRIAAELHDDVGSLLTQVSMESELLRLGLTPAADQPEQLRRMASSSRDAVRQMADVVWGLGQLDHAATLGPLLDRMRDHADLMLPPAGLELVFETDAALPALPVPAAVQQTLYLIYKESLHNAVKYAQGTTTVTASLRHEGRWLALRVADNGRALAAAPAARPGHGLANIAARAEAVGGSVTYVANEGFAVLARVPLG